ncbi:MAG: serine/threonine-protein kinase [bacterium]
MQDPLIGAVLGGRYHLVSVVGQGGMGIVYRAEDTRLAHRPCAVKLLMGTSMDPEEGARFERELAIISRLRSSHVVQVLDTGTVDGSRRFIVMELLEGMPLEALLKHHGSLPPGRAIAIAKGVLAALADAHEHGVVHRDLKPANVFISRSRTGQEVAKVLDFGIAKDMRSTGTELTAASMLIGTPKYMAPEQFLKHGATPATDLYAVGLLLYQMLSGRPPFIGEDPVPDSIGVMPPEFRVGWLHVNQPPAPIAVDPALWQILMALLAKEPTHRPGEAQAVIDALVAWEGTPAFSAGDPSGPMPFQPQEISSTTGFPVLGESVNVVGPPAREGGAGLRIALGLAAVLLAGAAVWLFRPTGPEPAPEGPRRAVGEGVCVDVVKTDPPGARVLQGDNAIGLTPLEIERPCREVWQVALSMKGYEERMLTLRGRSPREEISVPLKAEAAPAEVAPKAAADSGPVASPPRPAPVTPATAASAEAPRPAPRPAAARPAPPRPTAPRTAAPRPAAPRTAAAPETRAAPASASPLPF